MAQNIIGYEVHELEDVEISLSYRFLLVIGKFNGEEYFGYGSDNRIVLNYNEFEMFCILYDMDLKKEVTKNIEYSFLEDEDIKKLLYGEYKCDNYILSWS